MLPGFGSNSFLLGALCCCLLHSSPAISRTTAQISTALTHRNEPGSWDPAALHDVYWINDSMFISVNVRFWVFPCSSELFLNPYFVIQSISDLSEALSSTIR